MKPKNPILATDFKHKIAPMLCSFCFIYYKNTTKYNIFVSYIKEDESITDT